jgi:predicted short-subunit dehydrogenase-like oxidoreductase (DUF2520 family)
MGRNSFLLDDSQFTTHNSQIPYTFRMRPPILDLWLWIVGPGRAGSALARSWTGAGGRPPGILARTAQAGEEGARRLGGEPILLSSLPEAPCDLLVLAVPDDAIASVARKLAGTVRFGSAFHLSGALPASLLDPLGGDRSIRAASLHPLRAFAGASSENWRGAFVAVEGEPAAVEQGLELAAAVGANPRRLATSAKPLYHAGASLAAGGAVAVLSIAVRAWVAAGLESSEAREALAGLMLDAVRAAERRDFAQAFTGPVARRDLVTIRAHRAALAGHPDLLRSYALLAEETLRRTPGRGREEEIRQMLSVPTPSPA